MRFVLEKNFPPECRILARYRCDWAPGRRGPDIFSVIHPERLIAGAGAGVAIGEVRSNSGPAVTLSRDDFFSATRLHLAMLLHKENHRRSRGPNCADSSSRQ